MFLPTLILLMPLLLYLSVHDCRTMEIPDCGWFILSAIAFFMHGFGVLYEALAVFFFLLPFSLHDQLGFGDVKLCFAMAAFGGFRIFIVLTIASASALLYFLTKKGSSMRIPFGPFLCFGFVISLLF